jgi:hypothetical protein
MEISVSALRFLWRNLGEKREGFNSLRTAMDQDYDELIIKRYVHFILFCF